MENEIEIERHSTIGMPKEIADFVEIAKKSISRSIEVRHSDSNPQVILAGCFFKKDSSTNLFRKLYQINRWNVKEMFILKDRCEIIFERK